MEANTLIKAERLCSRKAIETLFAGSAKSFSSFPLRVVFLPVGCTGDVPATFMVSVSKKRFKRAVKRNRVKRQVREAYRKNKQNLWKVLAEKQLSLHLAFIYLDKELRSSAEIEGKVTFLLQRIVDYLQRES